MNFKLCEEQTCAVQAATASGHRFRVGFVVEGRIKLTSRAFQSKSLSDGQQMPNPSHHFNGYWATRYPTSGCVAAKQRTEPCKTVEHLIMKTTVGCQTAKDRAPCSPRRYQDYHHQHQDHQCHHDDHHDHQEAVKLELGLGVHTDKLEKPHGVALERR